MRHLTRHLAVAALVFAALAAGFAPAPAAAEEAKAAPQIQRVETKKVCMVNDAAFERDQIPVEVEGKTYFGCCEMCKQRLAQDAAVRAAVDPVSGKTVDKARAVIGKRPDGSVVYFESETNLRKYATSR